MTRLFALVTFVLFALLPALSGTGLRAQDEHPISQQELARTRFQELHDRMQKLQETLAKTAPDESKVLQAGNRFIQEAKIHDGMARAKQLLDQENWSQSLDEMNGVRKDLSRLLDLLQNRNLDLAKLLEQIARLQEFRNRVDTLSKEEGKEKDSSAKTEDLQKQLEAIAKAKAQIEQLLAEQKQLRADTNQLGLQAAAEATKPLADKEGQLKEDTAKLAKDLEAIEKKQTELTQPKDATPPPSAPKGGAGKAGSAASSMGKAQAQLGDKKPEPSLKDQDQAIEQLQNAKKELEELEEQVHRELQKLPFEQQAKAQEQTKTDTDTLAKDMEKSEEKGDNADNKPTPGRKRVQAAVPKQKAAAGTLKEYKPAKQKQQDAKDDLDAARDELDEKLAQLRQQMQDEVLRALEERFAAMLAKQKELSVNTKVIDKTRAQALTASGALPSSLVEKCQGIATGEFDLGTDAAEALKLLDEEGTTAVFPEMVTELRDQLYAVAKICRTNESGKNVQTRQAEIEDTLALLINSLRRTIEKKEGGGNCNCNGQPQLVPISAELKLLRYLQERVNKRTKDYDNSVPEELRATDDAHGEANDISQKQGKVRDLTRKLAVKLNQENNAAEGGR
ncbi:MAG TPA: hypothetical protein VK348_07485 [Planctomycetota bacterium]|nr:hypothetical protein [Planctomycetota bacterium]